MLNSGVIEVSAQGVTARVYYDATYTPVGPDQPLVNGPRGYALDVSNPTGRPVRLTALGVSATVTQGDPVTTGQAASRTAQQLSKAGYTTRGSVALMLEG